MSSTNGAWDAPVVINVRDPTMTDHAVPTPHTVPDKRGLFVVHAIMLHTGKVLWFCGHVEHGHYALISYLFDPGAASARLAEAAFPRLNPTRARTGGLVGNHAEFPHADLFCSHYVQLKDGKILLVGGSDPDFPSHSSVGDKYIAIFDPVAESWSMAQTGSSVNEMAHGRWYPTAVILGDGRVMVVSGRRETGTVSRAISDLVELLEPPTYSAHPVTHPGGASNAQTFPIYPGLHLAPNGKVYYTHTMWGHEIAAPTNTMSIEITAGSRSADWVALSAGPPQPRREEGMSLLLPPANNGKIMVFGGSIAMDKSVTPHQPSVLRGNAFTEVHTASDPVKVDVLDTTTDTWSSFPDLNHPRINPHTVILPDRTVLVLGGHNAFKWHSPTHATAPTTPSLVCEIIDPNAASPAWRTVASLTHPRMYHSAAVLMADGSVIVAGGADPAHFEPAPDGGLMSAFTYPTGWVGPTYGSTMALNRKDYEIYKPPYFFKGPRPTITGLRRGGSDTSQGQYGQTVTVLTPDAAAITDVGLMRPGAATHHTDSEQRYVELTFSQTTGGLTINLPTNRNLAPPGYYMVWISKGDVPCDKAEWLQLVEPPPEPVMPAPAEPPTDDDDDDDNCMVVTAAMGDVRAPEVVRLRALRHRIGAGGGAGRAFVRAVNALYYRVAPAIARRMKGSPALRAAVRDTLVLPAERIIGASDRLASRAGAAGPPTRLALLSVEGLSGLALLPLLAGLVLARTLANRLDAGGKDDGRRS